MDKETTGTERADRKKTLIGDLTKLPTKPMLELTPRAKKYYREMGRYMIKEKLLSESDLLAFNQLCFWVGQAYEAADGLMVQGMIQNFKTGARNVSPEFSVLEKCDQKLQQYYRFFGLTPYHRERLALSVKGNKEAESQDAAVWSAVLSYSSN